MHLIQGMFFQGAEAPIIGSDNGEQRVQIVPVVLHSMFMGMFGPDPDVPGELVGRLNDRYGNSSISGVAMTPLSLSFDKKYDHHEHVIHYAFGWIFGDVWTGTYKGDAVGEGRCWCVLTEVPDDLLTWGG